MIGGGHIIFVIITLLVLYDLNLKENGGDLPSSTKMIMINSSLLGFLGSLLYFSRKVYSYLITDKFHRVMEELRIRIGSDDSEVDRFRGVIVGYYVYLSTRPIAGVVIGPLLLMSMIAGLTTLSTPGHGSEVTVSKAGIYLVYVVSFIGGYSSSDLFDYFSNLGGKLISRMDLK